MTGTFLAVDGPVMRTCSGCKARKPLEEEFHRRGQGRSKQCKTCVNSSPSKTRTDEKRAQDRAYYQDNKQRWAQVYNFEKRYGITWDEYLDMLAAQDGRCAACGRTPEEVGGEGNHKRLFMDHDHDTTQNRELLCGPCNSALGLLGDDIERVLAVLAYLRKWKG
jgi:hypothetical protein